MKEALWKKVALVAVSASGGAATTYVDLGEDIKDYNAVEAFLEMGAPAGTVGTPTLDVTLEGTLDELKATANYKASVLAFTQLTTSAGTEWKATGARSSSVMLGRWMRVKAIATTASGTATYTGTLRLLFHKI